MCIILKNYHVASHEAQSFNNNPSKGESEKEPKNEVSF